MISLRPMKHHYLLWMRIEQVSRAVLFVVNWLGFDGCLQNTNGLIKLFWFKNFIKQVIIQSCSIRQPISIRRSAEFELFFWMFFWIVDGNVLENENYLIHNYVQLPSESLPQILRFVTRAPAQRAWPRCAVTTASLVVPEGVWLYACAFWVRVASVTRAARRTQCIDYMPSLMLSLLLRKTSVLSPSPEMPPFLS